VEDEETVKRKNRNAVRKKAAGEEGRFQEAKVSFHGDLHLLFRVVGKWLGHSSCSQDKGLRATQSSLATRDTMWPPTLGTAQQKSHWWKGWWT